MNFDKINQTATLNDNNLVSLMVFKMLGENHLHYAGQPYFALNIFKVKEVLSAGEFTLKRLPVGSELLNGLIEIRGLYVPIYNLSRWLGYEEFQDMRSVYIVCEVNGRLIGVHVAHILGVDEKSWEEIIPAETMFDRVVNQTQVDNDLCLIVDIEKMVNEISGIDLKKHAEVERVNHKATKIVLFADDQKSMRDYMKAILDNMGFHSIGFENGRGIIDFLETKGASNVLLVITDLEMPHTSGHSVIKYIKEGQYSQLPVYVHSSMTIADSERQALSMGADGFLGKVNTQRLMAALANHAS